MINRSQHITAGMGQPIDINNQAVIETVKLLNVADAEGCFLKVRWLYHKMKGLSDAG